MKIKGQLLLALAYAALLMLYPEAALREALRALAVFSTSFAPSLFPFFFIAPSLSCREAVTLYNKLFSRLLGALFGCPGGAAAPIMIGWLAGSPAGSVAAVRVAEQGGFTRAQMLRVAGLSTGLSPAFFLSAVGTGMLGSPQAGSLLLRSHFLSLVASGLLLRRAFQKGDAPVPAMPEGRSSERIHPPMLDAVLKMLTVCGWMVVFGVGAGLAAKIVHVAALETPILSMLEVAGGCDRIAGLALKPEIQLPLISAVCGFAGLSVIFQNMQYLRRAGIRYRELFAIRAMQAVLAALFTFGQIRLFAMPAAQSFFLSQTAYYTVIAAAVLGAAVPACVFAERAIATALGARRRARSDA